MNLFIWANIFYLVVFLRFKEFINKYRSSKISELFAITRGFVLSKQNIVSNGLYPVYSSQTLNNGLLEVGQQMEQMLVLLIFEKENFIVQMFVVFYLKIKQHQIYILPMSCR